MADITNLHRHRAAPPLAPPTAPTTAGSIEPLQQDEEFYHQTNIFPFDFDPFSLPNDSPSPSFFGDYATPFDFGFDLNPEPENLGCEYEIPDCIFGGEDDDEQMLFITDLFEPRPSLATETGDLIWDHEFDIGPTLGSGMGLRVAAIDSDSDSELNLGFLDNVDDTFGIRSYNRDGFEWEEVCERIQFGESDNLNLVINGLEEISVSSSSNGEILIPSNDEEMEEQRNLEWEVLLAVNNMENAFGFDSEVNLPEDHILTMEYDALFGELAENESALKGSPPAAKSVVDNLPLVVLTKEEIGNNNNVVCAVCKDEFSVMEKATKLPCSHLYHGDCIYPWLALRNTCPVCRFELPTDDADYEKRRRERTSNGNIGGSGFEVSYDFELLP